MDTNYKKLNTTIIQAAVMHLYNNFNRNTECSICLKDFPVVDKSK